MLNKFKNGVLATAGLLLMTQGCTKWEDHNRVSDERVQLNLLERVKADPELSRFAELLVKSGYADSIAASKTFTVYAPTNTALASLAAGVENDIEALRKFVGNHIARQVYNTSGVNGPQRIPMINGKYHDLTATAIDGVAITGKDQPARNGLIQVLAAALPALSNTWEFVSADMRMPSKQKITMVDSFANTFRNRVYDLRTESKTYTLFVLADNAWQAEVNKFKPFYMTGNADSTANLASWAVVKDFAVDVLYPAVSNLPDTVISKFGVKLGIDKSAVVEAIPTSNGMVYVMNKLEATPRNKFRDIIIEAENYTGASASRPNNTYIRDKIDSTGKMFRDILVYNHGLPQFNLRYRLTEMPSLRYRAYWMAFHDNINGMTTTFTQKLGVDSANSPAPAYVTVPLNTYAEQFAGEFTLTRYRPAFNLFLTAANSTSATANPIVCNYIRLEPVF